MEFFTRVKCPICGGTVEHITKPSNPPIYVTECLTCGWTQEEKTETFVSSTDIEVSVPETVRQGGQCPVCERVYSPQTVMCLYCGGKNKQLTYATGTGTKEN